MLGLSLSLVRVWNGVEILALGLNSVMLCCALCLTLSLAVVGVPFP